MKTPENGSATVYSGCSEHPKTHRSKTQVGLHMHPEQSISGALPTQEALSLRSSPALARLLLVTDRLHPRPRHRDAQGAPCLPATYAEVLDHPADGPVRAMGCRGRDVGCGDGDP